MGGPIDHLVPNIAEQKLILAAAAGQVCSFEDPASPADPAQSDTWGDDRTIRAEVLVMLCTGERDDWPVHRKGVRVVGAKITGDLDLAVADVPAPLRCIRCSIGGAIDVSGASLQLLDLSGSRLRQGLFGVRLAVRLDLLMRNGFSSEGEVRLLGASVGGDLICVGGTFQNNALIALGLDGADLKGSVIFARGFSAQGEVSLLDAVIGGQLVCQGGMFTNRGSDALSVDGAKVKGDLFLSDGFVAEGEVSLAGVAIGGHLCCSDGTFRNPRLGRDRDSVALNMDGAEVQGSVDLGVGFSAQGEVRLLGAIIHGQLNCDGGTFRNPDSDALSIDTAEVTGSVLLGAGFSAQGAVRLRGAVIGSNVNCDGGTFGNPRATENRGSSALNFDGAHVKGSIFLRRGFLADGEVRLLGAVVGGQLNCSAGRIDNPQTAENLDSRALILDGAQVAGGVFLDRDFSAQGVVRMVGAVIGGPLNCRGATVRNPLAAATQDSSALNLNQTQVRGSVFLDGGFTAEGEVRLQGAVISGQLSCRDGTFKNPRTAGNQGSSALNLDGADVTGSVFLDGAFTAEGEVRMLGAKLREQLTCGGGTFRNPPNEENQRSSALSIEGADVTGHVMLDGGFSATGSVRMIGARIGGSLLLTGSICEAPGATALDLEHAMVTGALDLRRMGRSPLGDINLRMARVGRLDDDDTSWPGSGYNVLLDGFVYGGMGSPGTAESRLAWIARQGDGDGFRLQPYEQLAGYYESIGHDDDARDVRIAERRAVRARGNLSRWAKAWRAVLDRTVRYGFDVTPTLRGTLIVLVLSSLVFWSADDPTIVRDTVGEGPEYFAPAYALDTFLPIVDLGQEGTFHIDTKTTWHAPFVRLPGEVVQSYLWFHILSGWVASTLLVASFTGIVRKK